MLSHYNIIFIKNSMQIIVVRIILAVIKEKIQCICEKLRKYYFRETGTFKIL